MLPIADTPDPLIASTLSQTQSRIASALLAHNPSAAEQAAQSMRVDDDPGPEAAHGRRRLCRGDHRHLDPRTADLRYRQGGAGCGGPPDPARHRIVARGQRAPRPCAVARFRPDADGSEMAEHRARHRRRADRPVRGRCWWFGAPCVRWRRSQPRSARWPAARTTPRSRRPTSTTRSAISRAPPKCSAQTLVDADAGARGGGARAGRAAARRGKLSQTVRGLGRRDLRHDARRRAAQRQPGAGADDGLRHAAGSDQRHRRCRRYRLCRSAGAGGISSG